MHALLRWCAAIAALAGSLAGASTATAAPVAPSFAMGPDGPAEKLGDFYSHVTSLCPGDFDGDGHADVAAAAYGPGRLFVARGDGTGSLGQWTTVGPSMSSDASCGVDDLDGDGRDDLVIAERHSATVTIARGQSGGGFATSTLTLAHPTLDVRLGRSGERPVLFATVKGSDPARVMVLHGDGRGGFAPAPGNPYELPEAPDGKLSEPNTLAVLDLNGDRRDDVVAVAKHAGSAMAATLLSRGDGEYRTGPDPLPLGVSWTSIELVPGGDLRDDGQATLLWPDYDGSFGVILADGAGGLTFDRPYPGTPRGDTAAKSVIAGDFNGDGRPDAVTGDFFGTSTTMRLWSFPGSSTASPFFPDAATGPFPLDSGHGSTAGALASADLDEDGRLDVIAGSWPGDGGPAAVGVMLNRTPQPSVRGAAISAMASTTAVIGGTIDPHGTATGYSAVVRPAGGAPRTVAGGDLLPGGAGPASVLVPLNGLDPATTYHVSLQATNSVGTSRSRELTFTTPTTPASEPPPSPGGEQPSAPVPVHSAADGPGSPRPQGIPTVSGNPSVGKTLTCRPGAWEGDPSFGYAWFRNSAPIAGANSVSYKVANRDAGTTLQCLVVASNAAGSVAVASAASVVATPPCIVPHVRWAKPDRARKRIKHAHCTVGKTRRMYSNSIPKGRSVYARPKTRSKHPTGTRVDLYVSRGAKP